MPDVLHALAAAGLVGMMSARVRMLGQGTTAASLWVVLVLLGVCQALQVGPVYRSIEHASGLPGGAALLTHAVTVLAAAATRQFYNTLDPQQAMTRSRKHIWLAVATLGVMLASYLVASPQSVPPALAERSEYYDETWPTAVGWVAYLLYLNWALFGAFAATRRFAREAVPGPLQTGLRLGAAGVCVGFAYGALKILVVVAWLSGSGPAVVRFDAVTEAVVLASCLLMIGIGSTFEALSGRVGTLRHSAGRRRAWRCLEPLAAALRPATGPSSHGLPAENDHQRLILRVTEIRDGQRSLRGLVDQNAVRCARDEAAARGHGGGRADLLAEAVGLQLARRAKHRGERPRPSLLREPTGGRDLPEEVRCLQRLAAACQDPFVGDFVDRHETAAARLPPRNGQDQ